MRKFTTILWPLLWVLGSLGSFAGLALHMSTGLEWVLAPSVVLALLGCLAGLPFILAARGRGEAYREVDRAAREGEGRDLGALIEAARRTGLFEDLPAVAAFLLSLSDDIALLQTSGVKFDLFASDIHFSTRNLASQSQTELDMLIALRERSEGYFARLLETGRELEELNSRVAGYAEGATALRDRALSSRELLAGLSRATGETSVEASGGVAAMTELGVSAEALAAWIRDLDKVVEREALEARKIGEALGVIDDIVERTHVLATNASIEAAHAGAKGAGFGVIAQEIRKLAASSRTSLADIGSVLGSIAKGIESSTRLSAEVRGSAARLGEAVAGNQKRFTAIAGKVEGIDRVLGDFAGVFSEQIGFSSTLATSAGEASGRIGGFAAVFKDVASDYRSIAEASGRAEAGAAEAHRSAEVLAQLAGYLKVGGAERNRVLGRYSTLPLGAVAAPGRREGRRLLLYNLEVRGEGGGQLGYLGDLSASGMLLLTDERPAVGARLPLRIILPLSSEGERSIALSVEVRSVQDSGEGRRVGCLFVGLDAAARHSIDELLSTLSLEALTGRGARPPGSPPSAGAGGGARSLPGEEPLGELEEA